MKNDGKFFMSLKDYKEMFVYTYVNKDVTDWKTASFLKLNDTTGANNSSPASFCGEECTEHKFTLTSAIEQEVWITAHTWDDRCMAEQCLSKWNENFHGLFVTGQDKKIFKYGASYLKPFTMTAGETLDIRTVWNFASEEIPSDFSVIAYAKDGDLTLTHTAGLTTDVMPVLGAEFNDVTPNPVDPVEPDTEPVEPVDPVDPVDPVEDEEIIGEPSDFLYECAEEGSSRWQPRAADSEGCTQCNKAWMASSPSHVYNKCMDTTVYVYGNACNEKHDRSRCNTGDDVMICMWSYDFSDPKKFKSDTKKCRTVPDQMVPWYSIEEFKY